MLKTLTKGACALAVAMTFTGTAAQADWHNIEIDDGAYMPIVTYILTGDNLIFTNESDVTHTINGADDSWTSGPIAPGERYIHYVDKKLPLTFSGEAVDGTIMVGEFTFDPAPLEEEES